MFIKLGLVSGCSEYCRRQSRPCGARGESARDEGRDPEQESAGEREKDPLEADLNCALQYCVSLLLDKVIRHQRVLFLYLFSPQSGFKVINPKAAQTFVAKLLI